MAEITNDLDCIWPIVIDGRLESVTREVRVSDIRTL